MDTYHSTAESFQTKNTAMSSRQLMLFVGPASVLLLPVFQCPCLHPNPCVKHVQGYVNLCIWGTNRIVSFSVLSHNHCNPDIDSLLIAQSTALGEGHSYVYWQSSAQKPDKTSVSTGPSTDFTVPSTPESCK